MCSIMELMEKGVLGIDGVISAFISDSIFDIVSSPMFSLVKVFKGSLKSVLQSPIFVQFIFLVFL